jgi:hypothetical protein
MSHERIIVYQKLLELFEIFLDSIVFSSRNCLTALPTLTPVIWDEKHCIVM